MEVKVSTVFIAGSITIKKLHFSVLDRLKNMMDGEFKIIVGDADGADKSIQEFLFQHNYPHVIVYHSGNDVRNNLGNWQTKATITKHRVGTRAFFTAKDEDMAKDADMGVMLWDSKSTGTLKNIIELISRHKKSTVFINKEQYFQRVYNVEELEYLIQKMPETALKKADLKIKIFDKIKLLKQNKLFI